MTLHDRAQATETVLKRFRHRPLDWQGAHCIKLARAQGSALGHNLPPVPMIRGPVSARKALAKQNARSVTELLDQYFPRHPAPAFMIVGDLCVLEGDPDHAGIEAVCIADGIGNLLGWHAATDFQRIETIKSAQASIKTGWKL